MVDENLGAALKSAVSVPQRIAITFGLSLITAIQAADALIVNVAAPAVEADLGSGSLLGIWLVTSYLCATAVFAPLTGRFRRTYGTRKLFFTAVSGFILSSMLCSLATSPLEIIAFRILQGSSAGFIHPLAQAILLDLYPKSRHGQIMAIWGAALMVGPILGPVLGGLITDLASWRWVFLINLPLGIVSICCAWSLDTRRSEKLDGKLDVLGSLLLMTGIGSLQLALLRGPRLSWFNSWEILVEATLVVGAFGLLVLRSRKAGFRVYRSEIFRDRNFAIASFYNFMNSGLLFVAVVFIPLLSQGPLGLPATAAGAMIMPRAIVLMLVMLASGSLIGRIDYRALLAGGWLLCATGLTTLAMARTDYPVSWILVGSLIQSLGAGVLYIPLATLAFSTLPAEDRTDATGLYSLLRQLGYASGVAAMTAILQMRTNVHMAGPSSEFGHGYDIAVLNGYSECFSLMAFISLVITPGIFFFRPSPSTE